MRSKQEVERRLRETRGRVQTNIEHDTAIQHMRFGAAMALAWVLGNGESPL